MALCLRSWLRWEKSLFVTRYWLFGCIARPFPIYNARKRVKSWDSFIARYIERVTRRIFPPSPYASRYSATTQWIFRWAVQFLPLSLSLLRSLHPSISLWHFDRNHLQLVYERRVPREASFSLIMTTTMHFFLWSASSADSYKNQKSFIEPQNVYTRKKPPKFHVTIKSKNFF